MKGVIFRCLRELVLEKFGEDVWKKTLKESNLDENFNVPPVGFVEDEVILKIVQNLCKILNVSLEEVGNLFED